MTSKRYVSRQGLTCCPGCKRHIKLAENPVGTMCPFCQKTSFQPEHSSSAPILGNKGKALLTAAVLGASLTLATCTPPDSAIYGQPPNDGGTSAPDTAIYGEPPTPTETNPPDTAIYGQPPDQ